MTYVNSANKLSVSVGIPAYNEEANIGNLLARLLAQEQKAYVLKEIIVVSDGSTDETALRVESVSRPAVKLLELKQRQGLTNAQNLIVAAAQGDILVLLDADVLPVSNDFIEQITRPLRLNRGVGLVGADVISASPKNFFESIIAFSHRFKRSMFQKLNEGENIYLCHGRARAFSRELYRQIHWQVNYAEDAYSYLFCRSYGLKFVFEPQAKVLFRSPSTLRDHVKQSRRFLDGRRKLERHFPAGFVRQSYNIPLSLLIGQSLRSFLEAPLRFLAYFAITLYVRLFSTYNPPNHSWFEVSESSKRLTP